MSKITAFAHLFLEGFIELSLAIQVHIIAAFLAIALVPFIAFAPKGTPHHKRIGRIWVGAMAVTAGGSLLIHEIRMIGPFSPIHLLSIFTLWSLWHAVRAIRGGNGTAHVSAMTGVAIGGLGVASILAMLPGRFFGDLLMAAKAL